MFAFCLDMPGATEQVAALVDDGVGAAPVTGLIAHVSGPYEAGWRIIDVWETEADEDRFHAERLGPAIARVMAGLPTSAAPFERRAVRGALRSAGSADQAELVNPDRGS
jgi:hypothetical protein